MGMVNVTTNVVPQISWAELVALSGRRNGDRYIVTDTKGAGYPDPIGSIVLLSADEFELTENQVTRIVEIV